MPEIPLCLYCHQAVLTDEQEYVIINKRESHSAGWQYAHASCHAAGEALRDREPEEFAVPV